MASLSRTTSRESAASSQTSQTSSTETGAQETVDGSASRWVNDTSPSSKGSAPGAKSRTASYSLLSNAALSLSGSRKSRFADVGTVGADVGRASISMPPPATKPSSTYLPSNPRRPSAVFPSTENGTPPSNMDSVLRKRSGDSAVLDDLEKTPVHGGSQDKSPPEPLMLPEASLKGMLRLVIQGYY